MSLRHPSTQGVTLLLMKMSKWACLAVTVACASCALERGTAFGVLEPTLQVAVGTNDVPDSGWYPLESGYEVQLGIAELGPVHLELIAPPAEGAPAEGGHSHGAVEAPPASATEEVVVELEAASLVSGAEAGALECSPACELPQSTIDEVHIGAGIVWTGLVRDTQDPPRLAGEQAFRFAPVEPLSGVAELDESIEVNRRERPRIALDFVLELNASLLEGIDFSTLSEVNSARSIEGAAEATLRETFSEAPLLLTVKRSEWGTR